MAIILRSQRALTGLRSAVFRADGSDRLGMGHIMRCLAFAAELRWRGIENTFVIRNYRDEVAKVIHEAGFKVVEIDVDLSVSEASAFTREVASKVGSRVIIADLCTRPGMEDRDELDEHHRELGTGFFLVTLSGGQIVDLPGNILVSPYVITRNLAGSPTGQAGQARLVGPDYFIFRPEFIKASRSEREILSNATRVLVCVGGSDELHLTATIVDALCSVSGLRLRLSVVIGPVYPDALKQRVLELLGRFDGDYEILAHDSDLAAAMLSVDLIIIGDGLIKYEAAVTGTPSIMISRFDSEPTPNQVFEEVGTTKHLGDGGQIPVHILAQEIKKVLTDVELRRSMSLNGKALVDGKGLDRIIKHIPRDVLETTA